MIPKQGKYANILCHKVSAVPVMFYLRCLMEITKNWRHQEDTDFSPTTQTIVTLLLHFSTLITDEKEKNSQRKKGLLRRIAVHAKPDIFYKVFRHIIIRQSAHSSVAYLL